LTKFSSDCPYPLTSCPQGLAKWIPLYKVLTNYKLNYLVQDISAGIALTAILIPLGIGYSAAAGLPPIYELYATIANLIAYAIFCPSRILILGPDSSLIPLISATFLPLSLTIHKN
jgi:MFS superfamily sulfate permease-like transporter